MNAIPKVSVSRVEAGGGFLIACTCGWRLLRRWRLQADDEAVTHQRSHAHPDPADQVNDLNLEVG